MAEHISARPQRTSTQAPAETRRSTDIQASFAVQVQETSKPATLAQCNQRLQLEMERLQAVPQEMFADTYERFLDYISEEELKQYD